MLKRLILYFAIIFSGSASFGYIEKVTLLKYPESGRTVVICSDNHFLGTAAENDQQASLFFKLVLPQIHKKILLSGSSDKLGLFVEAMNFYKFNNDNTVVNFNALALLSATINHKDQNTQRTWISHKLPWQFIEKYSGMDSSHQKSMFLKSIDPRLPIEFFRNLIVRTNDDSVLSLPVKAFALSDLMNMLNSENKKIIEKIAASADSGLSSDSQIELIKIVEKVFESLLREENKLKDILVKSFVRKFNLKQDWKSAFGAEAYENDYSNYLKTKDITINKVINDSFENFIFNNDSFSQLVDLIALVEICIGGPKYSIVFAGNEHAAKLIDYLQQVGFKKSDDDILNPEAHYSLVDEDNNLSEAFKFHVNRKILSIPLIINAKKFKSSSLSDIFNSER